jgi:hypothetical protein
LVKKRFLTPLNGPESCPAISAAGPALTILLVDFIGFLNWPEACTPESQKVAPQGSSG